MTGVIFTPLARIAVAGGDVLHALRRSDPAFAGFGEAYFSTIEAGAVKGWRRHFRMVMNLIVPVGAVRFAVFDEKVSGGGAEQIKVFDLAEARESYGRLTVQPGIWLAFQGVGPHTNLVLNLANIEHDPAESETRAIDTFPGNWLLRTEG